ncbi:MAG: hypothetical protein HYY05_02080, partial [Chloroflexi bacterium]|nr:hypothetical protein [Chloroflexota bacterium]
ELSEVLSGMLASLGSDRFTDDTQRLAAMFEQLAAQYPMFAPLAAGVDPAAVGDALRTLEEKKYIEHDNGHYLLTAKGRAHCVSSKQTLFNRKDAEQLQEAARVFDTI